MTPETVAKALFFQGKYCKFLFIYLKQVKEKRALSAQFEEVDSFIAERFYDNPPGCPDFILERHAQRPSYKEIAEAMNEYQEEFKRQEYYTQKAYNELPELASEKDFHLAYEL